MAVTMETARALCPQSGSMALHLETIFLVKINCIQRNRVEKTVEGVYFLFLCFNYFSYKQYYKVKASETFETLPYLCSTACISISSTQMFVLKIAF